MEPYIIGKKASYTIWRCNSSLSREINLKHRMGNSILVSFQNKSIFKNMVVLSVVCVTLWMLKQAIYIILLSTCFQQWCLWFEFYAVVESVHFNCYCKFSCLLLGYSTIYWNWTANSFIIFNLQYNKVYNKLKSIV